MAYLSKLEKELVSPRPDTRSNWQKVQDFYFTPKDFESSGELYEALGIRYFKKYLPTGDMRGGTFGYKRFRDLSIEQLVRYEKWTRLYETVHLTGFSVMTTYTVLDLANKNYWVAAITATLNIMVNIYPLMLQRYNRSRVNNILEKKVENIIKRKKRKHKK